MSSDSDESAQLDEISASIIAMAQLDFSSPPPLRGNGPLDAVAVGLIALGEELQASRFAQKEAETANESKALFLANMSHELRTPLMTILGGVELLGETTLNREQTLLLDQVTTSSKMLFRLITDILDFSRIEAGSLSIEHQPFDLGELLREVTETHDESATAKGLRIHEVRQGPLDLPVLGDAVRMTQVLNNLVGNAVKYTKKGTITVHTTSKRSGNSIQVSIGVRDTGPGIPLNQQARIFERFEMGDDSIRRRQSGAGLGLSIARSLIETMGGRITLTSEVGAGSSFVVTNTFPLAEQSEDDHPKDSTTTEIKQRILVVDDTEMVRTTTAMMLESLVCDVEVAKSGHEAMSKVAFNDYDLILMDCQMPLMDGLETSRRLLEIYPERNLKIVAITAHATPRDKVRSTEAGMVAHLNKPFNIEQLRSVIERFGPSGDSPAG